MSSRVLGVMRSDALRFVFGKYRQPLTQKQLVLQCGSEQSLLDNQVQWKLLALSHYKSSFFQKKLMQKE